MKMKNRNLIYMLMTAFAIISMSCNKLLDVPPQGKLTLDEFWRSKEQAVASIAGIYNLVGSTKQGFTTSGNLSATAVSPVECYIYWGEMRGELLQSNPGKLPTDQVSKENIDNYVVTTNDVLTKFLAFYKIINQANQAIKNIPGIRLKDEAFAQLDEDHLTGEAYFLRAFTYFWLVRTFKEVPLVLEPSETDNQDYSIPKSPTDTIFAQIVKDLDRAKLTLPDWYDIDLHAHCRATKYTAMTVLSDVYLWMAALSKDGALSKVYYQKAIDNCDAIINSNKYFMLHGSILSTVFSTNGTAESIFEIFASSTLNSQTNNLRDWFTSKQYFVVTSSFSSLFSTEIGDYRGGNTFIPAGPYPPAGTAFSFNTSTSVILKYQKSTNDAIWNFYRYPEVLFMKAEALAHLYVDDVVQLKKAGDLVNEVRARAFGTKDYPKVTGTTTLEMDNLILDERGREFIAEGKRWFELVRFASRDNFSHPELLIERVIQSVSGANQLLVSPRISIPDSWYLPFNTTSLASNPRLIQNPYYK
jgi:hypothetical protein